jgi:hypothetical protein
MTKNCVISGPSNMGFLGGQTQVYGVTTSFISQGWGGGQGTLHFLKF